MRLVRALTFAARFLKGGHDVIPELRDQSGSTRTRMRQAADECRRRDINSSESQIHGAQARLADNGRAQDGLISAGETVQGFVINGLTLEVTTSARQG
jgi:cellobiose-specific phosphotransferase system component IIA